MKFKKILFISLFTLPLIAISFNSHSFENAKQDKQWPVGGPIYIDANESIEDAVEWGKDVLRKKCKKKGAFAYETAWTYDKERTQQNYINLFGMCGTNPDNVVIPIDEADFLKPPLM